MAPSRCCSWRRRALLLPLLFLGFRFAGATVAAKAGTCDEGAAGVGTKLLYEDDDLKVWELTLPPGATAPVHTHEHSYVFTVLNGSTMAVHGAEGQHLTTFTARAGETLAFDLVGDDLVSADGAHRISKTHSATNVGSSVFREVLVEKKKQAGRTTVRYPPAAEAAQ